MFRFLSRFSRRDSDGMWLVPRELDSPAGFPQLRLRPMEFEDCDEWSALRRRNADWLSPWDSGDPLDGPAMTYDQWIVRQRESERCGLGVILLMEHHGRIVGQLSLGAIRYGSMRTGVVGYWVDREQAGHGYAPLAVALLADWALRDPSGPRLHRVEVAILPENERSRRVVRKLGMTYEGLMRDYMYVAGRWRDHEIYTLLDTDVASRPVTDRLRDANVGRTPSV